MMRPRADPLLRRTNEPAQRDRFGRFRSSNVQALASTAITTGPMRWVSAASGVVGLAFVVLMVIGDAGNPAAFGPIGHGGAERMIVYPAMLWLMAFGGYLMATRSGLAGRTQR